jgi:hypothetical protein
MAPKFVIEYFVVFLMIKFSEMNLSINSCLLMDKEVSVNQNKFEYQVKR